MRVAFALWPAPAHLYPLVPLAWALRSAGHEIVFVTHPAIGDLVAGEGLPFKAACSLEDQPVLQGPGGAHPEGRAELERITQALNLPEDALGTWNTVIQFFMPSMWDFTPYRGSASDSMPVMDGMVAFFKDWRPDLVVWDPCMPAAGIAARACGARHARYTGPDIVGWCIETFERLTSGPDAPAVDNPFVETIRAMAEKYDVPLDRETLFGQYTINPMPPAINLPVDTRMIPVRWLPHTRQDTLPDWLYPLPQRPRIALSLGVSVRSYLKADWSYIQVLLDAVSELDIEVVATLNDTQLADVSSIPDNVRVVDYIALDQLLPTCSALIHHGGLATLIAAGCARVPQLIVDFLDREIVAEASEAGVAVPRYALAPTTSAYVNGHGAGEVLDLSKPSVEGIRTQITRVLTEPSFQEGTARLFGDLLASPSPADVVRVLERLTAVA